MSKEDHKRTVAAIHAAVENYLQLEESQVQGQAGPRSIRAEMPCPLPQYSPWVQAGRQAVMERNYQIQFRFYR